MTASGGRIAAVAECLLGRGGRDDLVARAAEIGLEGAEDLRLVVHDEHEALIGRVSAWRRPTGAQA